MPARVGACNALAAYRRESHCVVRGHIIAHIAHRTSHIAHRTSHIAHRTSHIAHRTKHEARSTKHRSLIVERHTHTHTHTTHDTRHTTHDTRHTTHDTRHTTHDTRHTTHGRSIEHARSARISAYLAAPPAYSRAARARRRCFRRNTVRHTGGASRVACRPSMPVPFRLFAPPRRSCPRSRAASGPSSGRPYRRSAVSSRTSRPDDRSLS